MRQFLQGSLASLLLALSGCEQSAAKPIETVEIVQSNQSHYDSVSPSFSYATESGLELELAYQSGLEAQPAGKHIITVGHNGEGNLYMGNLGAVVKTLQKKLKGEVIVLNISSKTELLEYLAQDTGEQIDTIHSFGHGDDGRYWITGAPSDESLTTEDLLALPHEKQERIRTRFASDAYWKFYICHGAADNGYSYDGNIVQTIAEVFDVKTIGANAWVFLEATKAGTYMYPASRERHKKEFAVLKPRLGIPSPDTLYTQYEAAWVTYTPNKRK